ncbi:hypothetical protein [Aureispira sp. CCB-QB1]|uniref:hypothetical protein n=1 Tax=Aureispira sp. CCB-QB1 TaxID=1313421 RepID=UPI0012DE51C4|nr:hypothetical protein [Aureispira sp. CCB-QB1]
MNLIFTEQINKKPSYFIEKISNSLLLGMDEYLKYLALYENKFGKKWDGALSAMKPKKHSIREDKADRWKVGMLIHFIINPYNSNRFQFAPTLPVTELQKILILTVDVPSIMVFVDGRKLDRFEVEELAINDGFDNLEDFINYFKGKQDFEGKIIHWTHDFKY